MLNYNDVSFDFFRGDLILCFFFWGRRKRGEKGEVVETIEDVIVRRLTTERIEELKKIIRETQDQYRYSRKSSTWKCFRIVRFFLPSTLLCFFCMF